MADGVRVSPSPIRFRALAFWCCNAFALLVPAPAPAAPTASVEAIVEVTNPSFQHADGQMLWFNPNANGSVEVRIAATDAVNGVQRVDFPRLGPG